MLLREPGWNQALGILIYVSSLAFDKSCAANLIISKEKSFQISR